MSRREFLKLGGSAMLGLWLASPLLVDTARHAATMSNSTKAKEATADVSKTTQRVRPEVGLFTVQLRNTVMAEKEQRLMEYLGSKPHFATVIGADHVQIEDAVQKSSEQRLAFLKTLQPVLRHATNVDTMYKAVRCDFNGNEWQVGQLFEFPGLQHLVG